MLIVIYSLNYSYHQLHINSELSISRSNVPSISFSMYTVGAVQKSRKNAHYFPIAYLMIDKLNDDAIRLWSGDSQSH